jgi:LacI family transcriptional regulator
MDFAKRRTVQHLEESKVMPDAFLCFNDMIAAGVMTALRERGLSVPQEVAVTGFDDVPMSEYMGLTTIRVPGFEIGEEAMRLLFMRLDVNEATVVARNTSMELRPLYRASSEGAE